MDGKGKKAGPVYQTGQQIRQYQIIGILDYGAFIDRYLIKHSQSVDPLMMEVFLPPLINELKQSFLTQAQALMRLQHPHILQIQDVGVDNYYAFLVTSYRAHTILRDKYPNGRKQPLEEIMPYIKQLASALQYTHECKLFHGNICLENVLLTRENSILLRGFQIDAIDQNRKQLNFLKAEVTHKAIVYNAPEQIQGKAGPASDQYALAIVIYELLSGEPPFAGSYFQIADQHLHAPVPSLSQKTPGIAPRIERIIMKALEKKPEQRFSSVREFIGELGQEYDAQYRHNEVHNAPPAALSPTILPSPVPVAPRPSRTPPNSPSNPPLMPGPAIAQQRLDAAAYQRPQASANTPIVNSPLAPRRGNNTVSRRVFATGLIGLAMVGGAGGWYILSKRLTPPAPPSVTPDGSNPPATSTVVNNKNVLIFTGHLAAVNALTWAPDGRLIASASDDKFVQIFDAESGARKVIYHGHTEEVKAVAWSPNGKLIASGSQDATVQVWSAASGQNLFTYRNHTDRVNAVAWSRNSQTIASGSEDKTVQVWSAANGLADFNFVGHTGGVLCVGWQPDNSSVASGSWDGTLRDWAIVQHGNHFNAGEQIFSFGGHGKNEVYALSWSPNGNFVASAGADQTVQISSGIDGTPRPPAFTGHRTSNGNPVLAVAWSPNGDFIASGDTNGVVLVWSLAGRKVVFTYRGHKQAVNAIAWSPDGKKIASASEDATVQVWQPA